MAYKIPEQFRLTGTRLVNADILNKQNEGLPIVGGGLLGNLLGKAGSSLFHGTGSALTGLGFNNASNMFHSAGEYFDERLQPEKPAEASWDYISSATYLSVRLNHLASAPLAPR